LFLRGTITLEEEIESAIMEASLMGANVEGITELCVKRRRKNKKRENK
jgi:hypothetical protein